MSAMQTYGDVTVVAAASAADGMCRPLGYQGFVFVNGRFAGTISPTPMNARTDGVADRVTLYSSALLAATYLRYAKDDPLCCPTRTSTVSFRINRDPTGPVLAPTSATTSQNVQ